MQEVALAQTQTPLLLSWVAESPGTQQANRSQKSHGPEARSRCSLEPWPVGEKVPATFASAPRSRLALVLRWWKRGPGTAVANLLDLPDPQWSTDPRLATAGLGNSDGDTVM